MHKHGYDLNAGRKLNYGNLNDYNKGRTLITE